MNSARLLVETLRFHGGPPADRLVEAWSGAEGSALERLVAFEGCSLWVYRRLRQLGVLDRIDPGFAESISATAREETARNLLIESEARSLAETFQEIEAPAVFMKGVARRLSVGLYPLADARVTNDVDVLIPLERSREIWHHLRRSGYEQTSPTKPPRPQHHHLPALWSQRRVGVELHTSYARGISPALAWQRLYENGIDVERSGLRFRVPSATELLWSATAHSLLIPDLAFLLVFLFDAAVVWASGVPLDWPEIVHRLAAKEIVDATAAGAWLTAAQRLAGAEAPPVLQPHLRAYDLERALRLRLAVLRRLELSGGLRTALLWWTSDRARARA